VFWIWPHPHSCRCSCICFLWCKNLATCVVKLHIIEIHIQRALRSFILHVRIWVNVQLCLSSVSEIKCFVCKIVLFKIVKLVIILWIYFESWMSCLSLIGFNLQLCFKIQVPSIIWVIQELSSFYLILQQSILDLMYLSLFLSCSMSLHYTKCIMLTIPWHFTKLERI
jgi:hypothetical protein